MTRTQSPSPLRGEANLTRRLSDALLKVRPLGGSELFIRIGDDFYADPEFCGQCIEKMRRDFHEVRIELAQLKNTLLPEAEKARADQWRPIETAPKDGKELLLTVKIRAGIPNCCLVGHYMPGGHCIEGHPPIDAGWYFWNGCMFDKASEPTHWMPLPDSPRQRGGPP